MVVESKGETMNEADIAKLEAAIAAYERAHEEYAAASMEAVALSIDQRVMMVSLYRAATVGGAPLTPEARRRFWFYVRAIAASSLRVEQANCNATMTEAAVCELIAAGLVRQEADGQATEPSPSGSR
jgi:hypothetical protein